MKPLFRVVAIGGLAGAGGGAAFLYFGAAAPNLLAAVGALGFAAVALQAGRWGAANAGTLPGIRWPVARAGFFRARDDRVPASRRRNRQVCLCRIRAIDDGHIDGVAIFAIDEYGIASHPFPHEADLFVERDRPSIVAVHIEFDADEAGGPRLRQGRLDEPQPETTPAVGGNDPHPERSSMRARRKAVPPNVVFLAEGAIIDWSGVYLASVGASTAFASAKSAS